MSKKHIRPIRVDGQLAYVTLTKGYVAVIDAADVPLVEGFNWCADVRPSAVYAARGKMKNGRMKIIRLHRVLMGDPDGLEIDHVDGNGLNNTRANLRTAIHSENLRNQNVRINNASGFKGVSWDKSRCKWQAHIGLDFKRISLGRFETKEEAAAAYAKASAAMHGEFGRAS